MAYFALYYHPTTSCVWLPRVTNHLVWLYKKQVYTILLIFTLWTGAINMTDSFVVTSIVPVMHFSFLLSTCRYMKACMAAVFSLERLWIFLTFQKYICLPICLSVCACCLPICVSVCLAVCAWHLPICLSVSSVNHLAVFLSSVWCVFLYVCLLCISIWSVGLFVCLKDCEWTVPNSHHLVSVPLLFFTHRMSGLTLQLTLWMVRVWTSPCVVI